MLKLQPPHIAYKHLLDKGEDLTASEIIYLHNKAVSMQKLMKATKLKKKDILLILNHAEKYIENHKKVVMEMAKFTLTQAEYNRKKALGKKDYEIAKNAGVSQATLKYHKKKWEIAQKSEALRTPKLVLAEDESIPTVKEDLVSDLSKKLRKAEFELEVKEKMNRQLEKKISELEEQIKNPQTTAEDTEKEVAASHEYMEREQQLMVDANVWKQKALQYEAEYKRQTDTLKEERAEKERYKGEALAFRLALKAVL